MNDGATTATMADTMPQDTAPKIDTAVAAAPESQPSSTTTNGKRKAEDELPREDKPPTAPRTETTTSEAADPSPAASTTECAPLLSKNQLKRLRRQEQYQSYKEDRRQKRKDKRHARQERKRTDRAAAIAAAEAAGLDPSVVLAPPPPAWTPQPVPIAFVIDCDFEQYMREPEIISLASQVTRSYSQNRKARYQGHFFVSSWGGKLKERFENALERAHERWRGVHILEGDFKEAARVAGEVMSGQEGGQVIEVMEGEGEAVEFVEGEGEREEGVDESVVYLSSESPYTLKRLERNMTYVIGGLVDRNREKGLCYGRAKKAKVRTAKLPIGEYMKMQDRYVLTTNQVLEIMSKWLECGDWGEAFLEVIPKRKGGTLKTAGSQADADEVENADGENVEGETMVDDVAGKTEDLAPQDLQS